jgi:hypothetical protein
MDDEREWLRNTPELQQVLAHYAEVCAPDRQVWQDRLMHLEGAEHRDLVRLHGHLLAFGWLEQNTGNTPALRPGAVPGCYRITPSGMRANRLARRSAGEEDEAEVVVSVGGGTVAAENEGDGAPTPRRRGGRGARAKQAAPSDPAGACAPLAKAE